MTFSFSQVSGVGMGARTNADTKLQRKGFGAVPPSMVLDALGAAFASSSSYKVSGVGE